MLLARSVYGFFASQSWLPDLGVILEMMAFIIEISIHYESKLLS
jgi:hypothetical protein